MNILTHKEPGPYDLSNFTVLLVEDSIYMQSLITSMLKAFDVGDIIVCGDAKEAQELIKISQARRKSRFITDIDIILTDWLMPEGSGEDLLTWIRSNEDDNVRFLPVIVVSAYTTEYITSITRDLGANEILVKPVSGKGIASRICSVIDSPRPFIETADYFGPDRRRQNTPFIGEDRRKNKSTMFELMQGQAERQDDE